MMEIGLFALVSFGLSILLQWIAERWLGYTYKLSYSVMEWVGSMGVAMFLAVYGSHEWLVEGVFWVVVATLLIHMAIVDLQYQEIADQMNIALAVLGIIYMIAFGDIKSSLIGAGAYFGVFFLILVLTGAMGGGDVKMMVGVGLLLGIEVVVGYVMASFFIGALMALVVLIKSKRKQEYFAFGPALVLGFFYIQWIQPFFYR